MTRKFRLWVIRQRRVMAIFAPDEWIAQDATVDSKGRLCFSNGAKMKIWCRDNARCYTYVY